MRIGVSRLCALLAVPLCAASIGCAKPYDPFKVPAERVRAEIDTVAVPPLLIHPDVADIGHARTLIEPRVIEMLRAGGFEVVTPEEWDERWLAIAHEVGEIWDPATGERDDERYQIARSTLQHDLSVERGVDAIVQVNVHTARIETSGKSPQFCGTRDVVYWPEAVSPYLRVTLSIAACLGMSVADLEGREIYGIRHGLEIIDTYAEQKHASRPQDERLRDAARLDEALDAVVGPFANVRSGGR